MRSHESYGRLRRPAMENLGKVLDIAARSGDVQKAVSVKNALRRQPPQCCYVQGQCELSASDRAKTIGILLRNMLPLAVLRTHM